MVSKETSLLRGGKNLVCSVEAAACDDELHSLIEDKCSRKWNEATNCKWEFNKSGITHLCFLLL